MALPTVAAYLIANTLFISAIQQLLDAQPVMQGLNTALIGNMFIFYFGVVAQITPPVCLASFTAAGIANASAWKTGWKAFMFASVAFIAPFMFVYRPALVLEGTTMRIIVAGSMLLLATFCLGAAISGYMFKDLNAIERAAFLVIALCYIMPQGISDIIGVVGSVVLMAYCFFMGRKGNNTPKAELAN